MSRLTAAGFKVGRIEQMETAAEAKKKRGPKVRMLRPLRGILIPRCMLAMLVCDDVEVLLALDCDMPAA